MASQKRASRVSKRYVGGKVAADIVDKLDEYAFARDVSRADAFRFFLREGVNTYNATHDKQAI
jgi:hypothetical protein